MEDDTIKLLRECNSGIKMGISSIDDVMEHVKNKELRELLLKSKDTHCELGSTTHQYLIEYHDDDKEPPVMAKMMSWIKTNVKFTEEDSDRTVADLITDGCNMGIKSLQQYLNKYAAADSRVKSLVHNIIDAEEKLRYSMSSYL